MEKYSSDLHFHTTDSDGIKTNAERVQEILALDPKRQGIWATTNHDRFSPGFVEGAREHGIQALYATEISAHSDELDLSFHITCYAPRISESIRVIVDNVIDKRHTKIIGQIALLQKNGFSFSEMEFFQWITDMQMSPDSATNWHLAQYLWQKPGTVEIAADLTNGQVISQRDFMRECLRENGDFPEIGYHRVPRFEPELRDIAQIADREGIILSVAHPNFSFTKKLIRDYAAYDTESRIRAFRERIVPIITAAGIRNYEVNALARPIWTDAIISVTHDSGGLITFGSDNHGLEHADSKHGIFGGINPSLRESDIAPTISTLRTFV